MRVSALLTEAVIVSLSLFNASSPLFAQTAGEKDKKQPVVGASSVEPTGMTKEKRLSLCLESWDAATHMSKQEWRAACQRSIKDYPDAFKR